MTADPLAEIQPVTVADVLEAYGADNELEQLREHVEGTTTEDEPDPVEWMAAVERTEGRISIRIERDHVTRSTRRFYIVSRDEVGWVASRRRQNESFTAATHYRPRPASLTKLIEDADRVNAVLKEDLPLPLHTLFASATSIDQEMHDEKPEQCHGCGLQRYDDAGPENHETDFRQRVDSDESVWECGTCGTKTYLSTG